MVLARGRRARPPFLGASLIGWRPIFLVQGRVSLARTHALRLVISLADYFAVNIAVTLFRIVATFSSIRCQFTRVTSL